MGVYPYSGCSGVGSVGEVGSSSPVLGSTSRIGFVTKGWCSEVSLLAMRAEGAVVIPQWHLCSHMLRWSVKPSSKRLSVAGSWPSLDDWQAARQLSMRVILSVRS